VSSILLKRTLRQAEESFQTPAAEDKKSVNQFLFLLSIYCFFFFPDKFRQHFQIIRGDAFF
jgi:hypothetical protein